MIRQRGYSLIELMLVITVIAIATIGIIATYLTVNFNRKVNQTYDDLGEIVQNVEQAWGNMQSYNGLTNEIAIKQRLIPVRMMSENNISTPLGPLTLGYAGTNREMLSLTLALDEDGCNRLIPLFAPRMKQIKIGHPGQSATVAEGGEVNLQEVARLCTEEAPVAFIHFQQGFGRRAMWESW